MRAEGQDAAGGEGVIEIKVLGTPVAQGSKQYFVSKSGKATGKETAKGLPGWRSDVRWSAIAAMKGEGGITGPVSVAITFWFARPKKHFGAGKKAAVLRQNAPKYHTSKPDADKLCRAILDALTSVCFADDSRVAQLFAEKRYCALDGQPGARITINAL